MMDNGHEAIAQPPNPNASHPHYTTASEVATMKFVQCLANYNDKSTNLCSIDQLYNSRFQNFLVGALHQQIPSALNTLLWKSRKSPSKRVLVPASKVCKNEIIQQLVDLKVKLAATAFPAHGCLFYQKDIPEHLSFELDIPGDKYKQLRLGPVVDPGLWEDGRQELEVYRGPCQRNIMTFLRTLLTKLRDCSC